MFKKILIPVDLSEYGFSDKAVKQALELAKVNDAELVLLTVQPGFQLPVVGSFFPEEAFSQLQAELSDNLVQFAETLLKDSAVRYQTIVAEGKPSDEILLTASKEGADLIVMASQKHSNVNRMMLGSVTNKVVAHSAIAVLVVKP